MKTSILKKTALTLLLFFALGISAAHAQFTLPGQNVNDEAPINGLVGIALAAGAYFGARKLKK